MNLNTVIAAVIIMGVITFFTRAVPFLFFKNKENIPEVILFAEKYLPGMIMVLLVIYCLKDISVTDVPGSLNLLAGSLIVTVLHLVKKNALLSILGGTVCYMVLVQTRVLYF